MRSVTDRELPELRRCHSIDEGGLHFLASVPRSTQPSPARKQTTFEAADSPKNTRTPAIADAAHLEVSESRTSTGNRGGRRRERKRGGGDALDSGGAALGTAVAPAHTNQRRQPCRLAGDRDPQTCLSAQRPGSAGTAGTLRRQGLRGRFFKLVQLRLEELLIETGGFLPVGQVSDHSPCDPPRMPPRDASPDGFVASGGSALWALFARASDGFCLRWPGSVEDPHDFDEGGAGKSKSQKSHSRMHPRRAWMRAKAETVETQDH